MFYCRDNELRDMNRRYNKGSFECLIVYGRKRVGKTALINEFCKDKPTVFFSALNASDTGELAETRASRTGDLQFCDFCDCRRRFPFQ